MKKFRKFIFIEFILSILILVKFNIIAQAVELENQSLNNINSKAASSQPQSIKINYTIDISTSATGLGTNYLYDGITIPTVKGSNTYSVTVNKGESVTLEDISNKYVTPYNSKTEKDTKARVVLEFRGWKENRKSTILSANKTITWQELSEYAKNGVINLTTSWNIIDRNYQYVNFYINYSSVALDVNGNIQLQDTSKFTPSLWASYVGNASKNSPNIADETPDNSYTANSKIRALEGDKGNGSLYIYDEPSEEYIFKQLKQYAERISVDGEPIKVEELNTEHFEVRWYVFKLQDDGWHVDGKLVRKEGKMTIKKTFKGEKKALESVTGFNFDSNSFTNSNYDLDIKGGNESKKLYLKNSKNYEFEYKSSIGEQYILECSWLIDVKYGINYTITEENYTTKNYKVNSSFCINDPDSKQTTKDTEGNCTKVIGINNYAIDSKEKLDRNKILNVHFINCYIPNYSIAEIPETGGIGTNFVYIVGASLIGISIITYIKIFRKEKI